MVLVMKKIDTEFYSKKILKNERPLVRQTMKNGDKYAITVSNGIYHRYFNGVNDKNSKDINVIIKSINGYYGDPNYDPNKQKGFDD